MLTGMIKDKLKSEQVTLLICLEFNLNKKQDMGHIWTCKTLTKCTQLDLRGLAC